MVHVSPDQHLRVCIKVACNVATRRRRHKLYGCCHRQRKVFDVEGEVRQSLKDWGISSQEFCAALQVSSEVSETEPRASRHFMQYERTRWAFRMCFSLEYTLQCWISVWAEHSLDLRQPTSCKGDRSCCSPVPTLLLWLLINFCTIFHYPQHVLVWKLDEGRTFKNKHHFKKTTVQCKNRYFHIWLSFLTK